jgi:murein DD-endopeptidase MepM/ murein hydrolase activator NlpD
VKRYIFKILLTVVKALVITKRLIVWLAQATGRFFVWLLKPAIPLVIAPIYQISRRQWRHYLELSENPWERRWLFITSRSAVVIIGSVVIFSLTSLSVRASTAPGVIAGSHSVLLTKIITSNESDWVVDDAGSIGSNDFVEQIPTTMYRNGGSVAYVFPYTGAVGAAPTGETPAPDVPEKPVEQKKPIQRYAVQRGDTLARIAKKFGIKIETVLWANNLVANSVLRPGDTLTIPSVDGIIYTVKSGGTLSDVAKKYNTTSKILASANDLTANAQLKKGQSLIIPGARPPSIPIPPKPTPQPTAQTPPEPEVETPASVPTDIVPLTPEPEQTHADVIPRPALAAGEKLVWPTTRRSVTQYFSGGHPGLDIDGDYTDAIYAADDGTVVSSGWNNSGYGNMVLIDHGNGMVTRYGHGSKVYVAVGQQVKKGDVIAMVGTTGRSTGSHLHFEVIIRGKRVNPIKYLR